MESINYFLKDRDSLKVKVLRFLFFDIYLKEVIH